MDLQVSTAVDDRALTIDFTFRNQLDQDIYVDQYLPTDTWPPTRGGFVYAHRDGQLLLYLGTVPNPPMVCLVQEVVLYAELLPAFQMLKGSISLPIPIVECGKTRAADPGAPHELVSLSRLRVVVRYTPKQRDMNVREVVPRSGLYQVSYAKSTEVEARFHLLQPVEAMRRTDDFDRPFDPARKVF